MVVDDFIGNIDLSIYYSKIEMSSLLTYKVDTYNFNAQILLKANVLDVDNKCVLYTKAESHDSHNANQNSINHGD